MEHELSNRLRKVRLENGYKSQQSFADALGVHLKTVQRWESDRNPKLPDMDNLLEICRKYDCDLDYLIGRLSEPTHDIQFIHDQTGLTGEAIKRLQENRRFMFVLSLLIEQKDFIAWIKQVQLYLSHNLTVNLFPSDSEVDREEDDILAGEEEFFIWRKLISILKDIPEGEYKKRLEEDLKGYHWEED